MARTGRPRIPINWEQFDQLVAYQCTQEEIAAFFKCSVDTIDRALQSERGESFAEVWSKRRLYGKIRLRKAQFGIVERGGPGAATMAIYLDKKIMPEENPDRPPMPPPMAPDLLAIGNGKKTFAQFALAAGYPLPFPKQEEMRAFGFDETEARLLLGARGYGKTDYVTVIGVAYDIYLNYGDELHLDKETASTNLIISKSKTRNAALIEEIANALEANGVKLAKNSAYIIRVEGLVGKDHSVEAITIKTSMRGRHPKRIIMDDPVTEEDVSPAMRKTVKRKYDEAYKLCKNVIVIGQPAHADDLYAELRPILKKMEVAHGAIPQLDADLTAMLNAGVDRISIEMSYHLRVPAEGSMPFANIKYLDKYPNGDSVAFIDPSDGGNYTALTVLRGLMDGVAVYGKAWKRPWYHCIDEMVPILIQKGVRRLCFETNKHGNQPIDQLHVLLGPHKIGVVGKYSDSNKHAAIMAAGSYSNLIHLSRESDKAYTDQVLKYEWGAEFDDAPDSLARCLEWIGYIKGKSKKG
jgi:hypothetical protein